MTKLFFIKGLLLYTHCIMGQDSIITEYWDNQIPRKILYFTKEDSILIKEHFYYTDGTLWEKRVYTISDKTSLLTRYNTKGEEELTIPLNERGHMEGVYTKRYVDGIKAEEGRYKDGKPYGLWMYWYPSGKKEKEIFYDDKNVREKKWWENGNVKEETDTAGRVLFYHENGKIECVRMNTKNGQVYTYWYDTGLKREEQKMVNGEYYTINYWDNSGKQTIKNGNGYIDGTDGELGIPMRFYYKKGKRKRNGVVR